VTPDIRQRLEAPTDPPRSRDCDRRPPAAPRPRRPRRRRLTAVARGSTARATPPASPR